MKRKLLVVLIACTSFGVAVGAVSVPTRSKTGIVASQNETASRIGADAIRDGGTAIDALVATAFALAVTHPTAGNIGGGGFLVYRPASGEPVTYDFRETAPAKASPTMWLRDGKYDPQIHHNSYLAVGVPGTVAGLYLAWKEQGKLPWRRLVEPAIALARDGFVVTDGLSRSLKGVQRQMAPYPASVAQFTKNGVPYEPGEILKQPDLAKTLERIAANGPAGFYEGETAALIEKEMQAHGGRSRARI
jgi:gamma-glutamyltranspeptidase/glutathione hydrolase